MIIVFFTKYVDMRFMDALCAFQQHTENGACSKEHIYWRE